MSTSLRFIGNEAHYTVITFWYIAVATVSYWIILLFEKGMVFPTWVDVLIVCVLAPLGFLGKTTKTLALQHETIFMVANALKLQFFKFHIHPQDF